MLADKSILDLSCIKLQEKHLLPSYSGIYYVIDNQQSIWYIGRSINLQNRWNSVRGHHRYSQLLSISRQEDINLFIYYKQESQNRLKRLEKIQIEQYQPILNYTRVLKKGFNTQKKLFEHTFIRSKGNYLNTSLKILSIDKANKLKSTIKMSNNLENKSNKNNITSNNPNKFLRKFILLNNDEIGLNFELEICIDSQQRLFVRHYAYFAFYYNRITAVDLNDSDKSESCLSTIESRCKYLYEQSIRWLGYKLKPQTVLLIDKEEQFEIETTEIMLPFRMFVDLVEYEWMTKSNMSEILDKNELDWFKNESLSIKVAKYLHDNNLTLYGLLDRLEIDRTSN